MSLEIRKIKNSSDPTEEYILLQATKDLNLSNYVVADRTFDKKGNPSDIFRHVYRFPKKNISKGEYVSLRTGRGNFVLGKLSDGVTPVHRYFWGSNSPVWNDADGDRVEVLYVVTVAYQDIPKRPFPKNKI